MAIRRKKTLNNSGRISFKTNFSGSKTRRETGDQSHGSRGFLKVLIAIFIFAAIVVGFVYLDKYVKKIVPSWGDAVHVELAAPPPWVNKLLRDKIVAAAAQPQSGEVKLEKDSARLIQNNLQRDVAWLQNVTVHTTHNRIIIEADYRKPVAQVNLGLQKFYVDANLVVLDFIPMTHLPIVNVKGLATTKVPLPGEVMQQDDLAAAVALLARLSEMDKLVTPDRPLLFQVEGIDVSNFEGRQNRRIAHIILYAKDNTEIIWGAEIGSWAQDLEAKDDEKLAKLYNYYKEYGSLTGGAKYIDLRTPLGKVPLPIDKY